MKILLIILSLLLSLSPGGKDKAVASSSSSDTEANYSQNRDMCITASQGQTFAGDGASNYVLVRTTNAGRRTFSQIRSTFRVIKGGRIIDNNRTHPFLTPVFVLLSGTHISERYLLSICRLRL